MILTPESRVLTGAVLFFAMANIVVTVAWAPVLTVIMLAFLLLCQVGITVYESYWSAAMENRSLVSLLRTEARRSAAAESGSAGVDRGGSGRRST